MKSGENIKIVVTKSINDLVVFTILDDSGKTLVSNISSLNKFITGLKKLIKNDD